MTTTPQADCFDHDTWYKGPHGAPADDLTGVILAEFDPTWQQDHWETITVVGPDGSTTVTHPAPGFYPAPGGELLSWIACKGYDHPQVTTTTVAQETTTTPAIAVPVTTTSVAGASAATTSTAPPTLSVPSSTIAFGLDLDVTVCTEQPESCLVGPPELPATGINSGDAAGIAFGLLVAGGLAIWAARRRRATTPVVNEPASNVMQVRPSAGPFDYEVDK